MRKSVYQIIFFGIILFCFSFCSSVIKPIASPKSDDAVGYVAIAAELQGVTDDSEQTVRWSIIPEGIQKDQVHKYKRWLRFDARKPVRIIIYSLNPGKYIASDLQFGGYFSHETLGFTVYPGKITYFSTLILDFSNMSVRSKKIYDKQEFTREVYKQNPDFKEVPVVAENN